MVKVDYANGITDSNLGTITINGEDFTGIGYQGLMTVNTKTYVEEPVKSNDGSIPNIEDHITFVVPRCKVNFKYFNIRDYQSLCRILASSNQFPVTFFDKQFGERRTYMMYCEPEEMTKIYNCSTTVLGLLDYEVSFIGTLNNLANYTISFSANGLQSRSISVYNDSTTYSNGDLVKESVSANDCYKYINSTSSAGQPLSNNTYWKFIQNPFTATNEKRWGDSITIPSLETITAFYIIPTGKQFNSWNTEHNGTGFNAMANSNWTVFENATLYVMIGDVQ